MCSNTLSALLLEMPCFWNGSQKRDGHSWVNHCSSASLVFLAVKQENWDRFSLTALRERARSFILAVTIEER